MTRPLRDDDTLNSTDEGLKPSDVSTSDKDSVSFIIGRGLARFFPDFLRCTELESFSAFSLVSALEGGNSFFFFTCLPSAAIALKLSKTAL